MQRCQQLRIRANPYEKSELARRYDQSKRIWLDGVQRVEQMSLTPEMTALDIGSGPGILAIPLAKKISAVTAVEPSAAMRKLLDQRILDESCENIAVLPKRWEEIEEEEIGQFDLVIASYSLFFPDWRSAFEKMNRVAKKQVILYWFSGVTSWEKQADCLLPTLNLTPPKHLVKCDRVMEILQEMGISAQIKVLEGTRFPREFDSLKSAVEDLADRTKVRDTALFRQLERYIMQHYTPLPNGGWRYEDDTIYTMISWIPDKI